MFAWLKRRRAAPAAAKSNDLAIAACVEATARFGDLLEKHAGLIVDSKMLPVPKDAMKMALQTAWKVATEKGQREAIEVGYLSLADFQDGVGDKPINLMLSADADPLKVTASLGAALPWMNKTTDEMHVLKAEFEAFKRTQAS